MRTSCYWISPNGKELAYLDQQPRSSAAAAGGEYSLAVANLASGTRRVLVPRFVQSFPCALSWSPNGEWLAYTSMARPTYEADRQVVQLRDLRTGRTRALTQAWDRSVNSIAFRKAERKDADRGSPTSKRLDTTAMLRA